MACTYGTVKGLVFDDRDGDGVQDGQETGRGGVTVRLLHKGVVQRSVLTDSSGLYVFGNVPFGSYQIEVGRAGRVTGYHGIPEFRCTVADTGNCSFSADFGIRYCSRLAAAVDPPGSGQIPKVPDPNCQGGAGGQALYNPGTTVTLTVQCQIRITEFSAWRGDTDVTGSMPLTIKIDG